MTASTPNVIAAMPMGGGASNGGRNVRIVFNPATYSITDKPLLAPVCAGYGRE